MTLYQTQPRHHGAKNQRKSNPMVSFLSRIITKKQANNLFALIGLGVLVYILSIVCLDTLDKNIYPGCKVLGQSGKILTIRLNPELANGSDGACLEAGKLIHKISLDGYLVRVTNMNFNKLGTITPEMAFFLSKGY